MLKEYTVVQDSREKIPLLFPKHLVMLDPAKRPSPTAVKSVRLNLSVERLGDGHPEMERGDYYLRGYPDRVVVERKGSIAELAMNCFRPRRRARIRDEAAYLASHCRRPIWMVFGSPRTLLTPTKSVPNPGPAVDCLLDILEEHRVELWIVPKPTLTTSRRAAGEMVARAMIRSALT